jgi:hypothetical protein
MAILSFKDFTFEDKDDFVRFHFLKIFYFDIKKSDLTLISDFKIKKDSIEFISISESSARRKFLNILEKGFASLKNMLTYNPAIYIHKNSGLPLIGSLSFGIVDKGTDMLELKPITGCNINCIFCSVDEGSSTKKALDFVIEKDYLVQETKKLLDYKKVPCHIYINPHGEPLLYADIVDLIHDLSKLDYVKGMTIITNGMLLNEKLATALINAGLTDINISINAVSPEKAKHIANSESYDVDKILELVLKVKDKVKLAFSPVLMYGINNEDIEALVAFCKENMIEISIQNFLCNRRGRKPAKEISFEKFYTYLEELEKKYDIKLIKQGKIDKTIELKKPFRKNDVIEAEIFSQARYKDESLAIAKDRIITVKCQFIKSQKRGIIFFMLFPANQI